MADTEAESRAGDVTPEAPSLADTSPSALAADLLVAIRRGADPTPYLDALARLAEADLEPLRRDREAALAFWLDCYNAATQHLLDREPWRYESPLRFVRFFRTTALRVADTALTLDAIDHGILRGGRSRLTLGYHRSPFQSAFARRYAIRPVDPRVHFALNCGAESCPAIRAYDPAEIDEQLDLATETYLDQTVRYDRNAGVVRVPRLFLWYRGDFGGKAGVYEFLRRYDAIPADATPTLRHRSWSWTKAPARFAE